MMKFTTMFELHNAESDEAYVRIFMSIFSKFRRTDKDILLWRRRNWKLVSLTPEIYLAAYASMDLPKNREQCFLPFKRDKLFCSGSMPHDTFISMTKALKVFFASWDPVVDVAWIVNGKSSKHFLTNVNSMKKNKSFIAIVGFWGILYLKWNDSNERQKSHYEASLTITIPNCEMLNSKHLTVMCDWYPSDVSSKKSFIHIMCHESILALRHFLEVVFTSSE